MKTAANEGTHNKEPMALAQFIFRECSVQVNEQVPYCDHLRSAKDQKSVENHRLLVGMAASGSLLNCSLDVETAVRPSAMGQPSPQITSMPLVCQFCGVAMNCENDLNAHIKGKKHKNALQREEHLRKLASAEISPLPSAVTSPPRRGGLMAKVLGC
ncbi:hypothetical protein HPB51_007582 [Rhipicephalus microplus]|uniref:C2H2-type domain-containing protein n=1 Tax=Rhipicephalus microplus TaxID=6941 RepID=A0A9J6EG57_RHIMP|nr:hypothetical protein HPB51_007582 [Rhipicephalus microplus]